MSAPIPAKSVAAAADWYARVDCEDGITLLHEHHIARFYRCNIWHVRGRDRSLLFDSGSGVVGLSSCHPWLHETPLLAVASHSHFDHIGCHHEFGERACHGAEAHILADPTPEATLAARYATFDMFERLPPGGFDPARYQILAAPATRLLAAGDVLSLGDRSLEVLHVPGHSPGSIALWEAATGLLFAGDAVYDGPLVDDAYHSDIGAYLDTMARLRELPVRVVHAGHFPSFGRDRYRELIDEYLRLRRAPGCPADARSAPRRPASPS